MKRQGVAPAMAEARQATASAPSVRRGGSGRATRFDPRSEVARAVESEQVRQLRLRARELREIANQFSVPSAQDRLRRLAARCDGLADDAEAAAAADSEVRLRRRG